MTLVTNPTFLNGQSTQQKAHPRNREKHLNRVEVHQPAVELSQYHQIGNAVFCNSKITVSSVTVSSKKDGPMGER